MGSARRISFIAGVVAIAAALALPSGASASVTCSLSAGVLTVDIGAGSNAAGIQRGTGGGANDINVYDGLVSGGTLQSCTGSPTVLNTDSIQVNDTLPAHDATLDLDLQNGPLEPGVTDESPGTSEIEVTFNGSTGTDTFRLTGQLSVANDFVFGQTGATAIGGNLNADGDVNDVTVNDGERMTVLGGNQADTLSVAGGAGFTGPVPYDSGGLSVLHLDGGLQDDHLIAGPGGWAIDLGNALGNDTITGGSGNDELGASDPGDDVIDGAGGTGDTINYQFASPGGVHFDLGVLGAQDTGVAGNDSAVNVEGIVGSQNLGTDVLVGNAGNNIFFANAGDDLIVPKGGNDLVEAGTGNDTVSYAAGSSGPVTVGLVTGPQATGGSGTDIFEDQQPTDGFVDVENLIGSPFGGDVLTGDAQANKLDVYDGFGDTANCVAPAGGNVAVADEIGVDTITNCSAVDNAPQTSITSGPANGATISTPSPTYGLASDEPASFQYAVDGGGFVTCGIQCHVDSLPGGSHTLSFRAVDQDENLHADLTPATRTVTVSVPGPRDTTPPDTKIGLHPKLKTTNRHATFTFTSPESGVTFLCRTDRKKFRGCSSPFAMRKLKRGKHRFDVAAVDAAGNRDRSPASFRWKVIKRKRR